MVSMFCLPGGRRKRPIYSMLTLVLDYFSQIETVQAASDEELPQLELQIKTSLLPLKESIAGQMGASSASPSSDASVTGTVSSISVEEPQQEVAADVLTAPPGPVDDAWMSECSTGEASSAASDASGEVEGLDELDFECFSVIMEEEAAAAANHSQPRSVHFVTSSKAHGCHGVKASELIRMLSARPESRTRRWSLAPRACLWRTRLGRCSSGPSRLSHLWQGRQWWRTRCSPRNAGTTPLHFPLNCKLNCETSSMCSYLGVVSLPFPA